MDASLLPRLFCDESNKLFSARSEYSNYRATVVENSGSVANNDRINFAGLPPMLVRYVCQSVRKRASVKEKKKETPGVRLCGEVEGGGVFEKLKKNRGGVYRSRGWKNFSDGGF